MAPEVITLNQEQVAALASGFLDLLEPKLRAHFAKNEQDVKAIVDGALAMERKAMDERMARFAVPGLTADSKEVKDFSFERLVRGLLFGQVERVAPHEVEMCRAARQAAGGAVTKEMTTQLDSLGGFLVPSQVYAAQMIPLLQANTVADKAGVFNMPGLTGAPQYIPRITGGSTVYWLTENGAPTKSNVTLGQIAMWPHHVFASSSLSNFLIDNSTPAADELVRNQIATDIGIERDRVVYRGSGADGEPLGILNADGASSVTSFGDITLAAAYDKLLDMEGKLDDENADKVGEYVWVMHTSVLRKMRKMKDPTDGSQPKGRRMIDGEAAGPLKDILGYRYFKTTHMPTDSFLLAAHKACVVGTWGTMILASSREGDNFRNRTTELLIGMTMDVGHREPKAYCIATGAS